MNKLQFVPLIVTTASSFLLVLLAWMQSNVRMPRLESVLDTTANLQFADVEELRDRLTTMDNHRMTFCTVTGKLGGRMDELSRR